MDGNKDTTSTIKKNSRKRTISISHPKISGNTKIPKPTSAPSLAKSTIPKSPRRGILTLGGRFSDQKSKPVCTLGNPLGEIMKLRASFPDFPKKMMECLVIKYNGNCGKVFKILTSKGWTPSGSVTKKSFTNGVNSHFTLHYYHGRFPGLEKIKEIIKDKQTGSFLTYYKTAATTNLETKSVDENSVKYFVCCKLESGEIAEKHIQVIEIPDIVRDLLSLTESIKAPRKRDLTCVPGYVY